jgi:hypothetical protein
MEEMSLELELFGEIETAEAFKALVEALSKFSTYEGDVNAARAALLDANVEGEGFKLEEGLYDYYENPLAELIKVAAQHKIDLVAEVTEGGMQNPGTMRFVRNGLASFELPTMNGEVLVNAKVIAELRKRRMTTLDQLDDFLGHFHVDDLPKFTVSNDVIASIYMRKPR